jgi:hypothetical protein
MTTLYIAENPRDTLAAASMLDTEDDDRHDRQIAEYARRYATAAARVAPDADVLVSEDAPKLGEHHRRNWAGLPVGSVERVDREDQVRELWQAIHDAVDTSDYDRW